MKPNPFSGLNHFTVPVLTNQSPPFVPAPDLTAVRWAGPEGPEGTARAWIANRCGTLVPHSTGRTPPPGTLNARVAASRGPVRFASAAPSSDGSAQEDLADIVTRPIGWPRKEHPDDHLPFAWRLGRRHTSARRARHHRAVRRPGARRSGRARGP